MSTQQIVLMADEMATYRQALQEIANGAVRCQSCGMRGVVADAVVRLQRMPLPGWRSPAPWAALCGACLEEERRSPDVIGHEPVTQPHAVLIARKALEAKG